MKVRAIRGVCIGVERHMVPLDVEDLDPVLANYLVSIGAVERVIDEPAPLPIVESEPEPTESDTGSAEPTSARRRSK